MGDNEIQAFIFDLDGVLTDTAEYHYLGWQRLADEEGIPFDREAGDALRGVARRDSLMRILDGRPADEEQIQEPGSSRAARSRVTVPGPQPTSSRRIPGDSAGSR